MKKFKFKIFTIIITIAIILGNIRVTTNAMGFADYDDATADAEAKKQLEEQEKEQKENIGKSKNNYLEELSIKGYKLTPNFDKQTIDYVIEDEISAESLEINAKAEDEKAKISGNGVVKLQSGENEMLIEVTAESGTVRTYSIKAKKKIESDVVKLKSLKLFAVEKNGEKQIINLDPEFSKDVFQYKCEVYSDVEKIELEKTVDDDIEVSVEGNEKLKLGKNEIIISLKTKDESGKNIYKIEVIKKENKNVSDVNKNENKKLFAVIVIIIFILLICTFIKPKKKKKNSRH